MLYIKKISFFAVVSAMMITLSSCEEKKQPVQNNAPIAVTSTISISEDLPVKRSFIGKVVSYQKVEIKPRVQGFLRHRAFKEGGIIKKGQLLFSIEKDQYKAALKQAEANLAKAEAEAINADIQLQRAKDLILTEDIAQSTLDNREAAAAAAIATVKLAKAALEDAKLNLGYTDMYAPFSGRIGLATYDEGEYITPSSGSLATLVSIDPISVEFAVSMKSLVEMYVSTEDEVPAVTASILISGKYPYKHEGKIDFIDNMLNYQTDTLKMRAKFSNPEAKLVDGQLVTLVATTVDKYPTVIVPQSAVQRDQAGAYLMVVKNDNKIEMRRVTVGEDLEENIVVTKGLEAGEKIVFEGLQKIKAGSVVKATTVPMDKVADFLAGKKTTSSTSASVANTAKK